MRVAIIAGPYAAVPPIHYGGTEQVITYLIKGLLEAGHEPILLGPANSEVDCKLIPTIDRALGFPRTRTQVTFSNQRIAAYTRRTRNNLEKLLPEIDVIHSHGFDLSGFEKFPNVTTVHNAITFDDLDYFKERSKLRFIAVSKNQLQAFTDISWAGIVHNGEDPKDFPFTAKPRNYLSFLGRMDQDKNPHLAIQLAIKMGMKIKLAGKADHFGRHYFRTVIRPYLRHPLVEYLGEIDFKEKVRLLRYAKCNLHPTNFREPFGLTVLEAALVGTPTLAIRRGALPELIEDGKTGILVEDFVEAYGQIARCFAMDRQYIARRAAKRFSHTRMSKGYLKMYKDAIRASKRQKRNENSRSNYR